MKIAVIGAGFGGLSAAAYLAKAGHKVEVFERNQRPGGRAYTITDHGFTFDLGPNWYTMPDVYEAFFRDFGHEPSDFYRLQRLNPGYRAYFSSKEWLDVHSAPAVFKDFDSLQKGSGDKLNRYLQHVRHEYRQVMDDILTLDGLHRRQLARPSALEMLANPQYVGSLHQRVNRMFGDERLQKIIEFMAPLLGGSPKTVPGLYGILSWVDFGLGIWYPNGGFSSVAKAFEAVAKEQGAKFHYGQEVERIHIEDKRAKAIVIDGKKREFHAVVASADYPYVETNMLEQSHRTYGKKHWERRVFSSSAVVAAIGVNRRLPLRHHGLFFDAPWYRNFDDIFEKHRLNERPLFYLAASSVSDAAMAPKDSENLVITIPVSNKLRLSKRKQEALVNGVLRRIEEATNEKFREHIAIKHIFGPEYYEQRFHAYGGSAFGLSHTLLQSGPLRPRMQSKKVPNLYFAGQSTNPGSGVPLVILSGKLVADIIKTV